MWLRSRRTGDVPHIRAIFTESCRIDREKSNPVPSALTFNSRGSTSRHGVTSRRTSGANNLSASHSAALVLSTGTYLVNVRPFLILREQRPNHSVAQQRVQYREVVPLIPHTPCDNRRMNVQLPCKTYGGVGGPHVMSCTRNPHPPRYQYLPRQLIGRAFSRIILSAEFQIVVI